MAEATGISWADATFNPWVGCDKVSPGCAHCYAEDLVAGRMGRGEAWGADGVRQVTAPGNWQKPRRWATLAAKGLLPDGSVNRDGHRPRVFCASLADVFEERPELDEPRFRLFELIDDTPTLDWMILTKRPEHARDWLQRWYAEHDVRTGRFASEWAGRDSLGWGCPPNVWLGVSIENARFTWRADVLREVPAAVRFISAEPLLGSLFTVPAPGQERSTAEGRRPASESATARGREPLDLTGIDLVIVGGESGGRDSRPMHPAWAREIRDACQDVWRGMAPCPDFLDGCCEPVSPIAFHFKQWGSYGPASDLRIDGDVKVVDGGMDGFAHMRYAGSQPNAAGKTLDGAEWCEFPEPLLTPA